MKIGQKKESHRNSQMSVEDVDQYSIESSDDNEVSIIKEAI